MISQDPKPGYQLLHWVGDMLHVQAKSDTALPAGEMVFRTNIGQATTRNRELDAYAGNGTPLSGHDWHDIKMTYDEASETYAVKIPLLQVGVFSGKCCFLPKQPDPDHLIAPIWPVGENLHVKVAPAHTVAGNMIYAAFTRQFKPGYEAAHSTHAFAAEEKALDHAGYTVIPPSGTFRQLIKALDHIFVTMGFKKLLLLPIHPTPTTYARMGRYGSPFASRDFLDIDPALAEFDTGATPLDQFHELVGAVHARGGHIYMDLPANHTGWASTFMIHHPQWFKHNDNGTFHSPGAWGTTWEDLVELDYCSTKLRKAMAEVFVYWCKQGVDGFRCDAGYMIPADAWAYIVAHVRLQYPNTVFLLEGLGGSIDVTSTLLRKSHLDWAYSELFQTYDRRAFEQFLPQMNEISQSHGPLVHFAETHDNLRLAQKGSTYARLRTMLSALLSQQGAFGITAGVEWFAQEKIDVHGAGALNWGNPDNQVKLIAQLNTLLCKHPSFGPESTVSMIQTGGDNTIACLRESPQSNPLLILINLDHERAATVTFNTKRFDTSKVYDLLTGGKIEYIAHGSIKLPAGQVLCLTNHESDIKTSLVSSDYTVPAILNRARRVMAMQICQEIGKPMDNEQLDQMGLALAQDPRAFCTDPQTGLVKLISYTLPTDLKRHVMVPPGYLLDVTSKEDFSIIIKNQDGQCLCAGRAVAFEDGSYHLITKIKPLETVRRRALHACIPVSLTIETYRNGLSTRTKSKVYILPRRTKKELVKTYFSGDEIRSESGLRTLRTLLVNGTGAMAQMRLAWGDIQSQYDCLLGMNLHPKVPVDRLIFLTRCRIWMRYHGFSVEVNKDAIDGVQIDPAGRFAIWDFLLPCGMGRRVALQIRAELEPGKNRMRLTVTRAARRQGVVDQDDILHEMPLDPIQLIIRPDIEWRNFHEKTKAFNGFEALWPSCTTSHNRHFDFVVDEKHPVSMGVSQGEWHYNPLWEYMIPHPEEAARGQEGTSDLFSPGWFKVVLDPGESVELIAGELTKRPFPQTLTEADTALTHVVPCIDAMSEAIKTYVVKRDAHKTVIAGYPWFLDWGRDTLIVLRGVLASGDLKTVYDVLAEFGRFEKGGTIPNMIRGEDDANRETVDAPLWFGTIVRDVIKQTNSSEILMHTCGERTYLDILISIATHYIQGTENGIQVDPETGLVYSPSHYTWMDTNYPAGTPRQGYNVEIQALWVNLLDLLAQYDTPNTSTWNELAQKARNSFATYFTLPNHGGLADNLRASAGQSAKDALQDDAVRSNQLYAITLGLLKDNRPLAQDVLCACESLLTPGSMRSLADRPVKVPLDIWRDGTRLGDPNNPYRGRYEGDEDTRRKPAYHNGTGWTFTYPCYAEALYQVYGDTVKDAARAILTAAVELINCDCVGHLPEITHGDAPHAPCGTGAQAWGVSELYRVLTIVQE